MNEGRRLCRLATVSGERKLGTISSAAQTMSANIEATFQVARRSMGNQTFRAAGR